MKRTVSTSQVQKAVSNLLTFEGPVGAHKLPDLGTVSNFVDEADYAWEQLAMYKWITRITVGALAIGTTIIAVAGCSFDKAPTPYDFRLVQDSGVSDAAGLVEAGSSAASEDALVHLIKDAQQGATDAAVAIEAGSRFTDSGTNPIPRRDDSGLDSSSGLGTPSQVICTPCEQTLVPPDGFTCQLYKGTYWYLPLSDSTQAMPCPLQMVEEADFNKQPPLFYCQPVNTFTCPEWLTIGEL